MNVIVILRNATVPEMSGKYVARSFILAFYAGQVAAIRYFLL